MDGYGLCWALIRLNDRWDQGCGPSCLLLPIMGLYLGFLG